MQELATPQPGAAKPVGPAIFFSANFFSATSSDFTYLSIIYPQSHHRHQHDKLYRKIGAKTGLHACIVTNTTKYEGFFGHRNRIAKGHQHDKIYRKIDPSDGSSDPGVTNTTKYEGFFGDRNRIARGHQHDKI